MDLLIGFFSMGWGKLLFVFVVGVAWGNSSQDKSFCLTELISSSQPDPFSFSLNTNLRFGTLNLFHLHLPDTRRGAPPVKSEKKWRALSKLILQQDLDIVSVQEVGSKAALNRFLHLLKGKYRALLFRGWDAGNPRFLHVALLIKNSLPLTTKILSHKNFVRPDRYPLKRKSALFPRDVPAVVFSEEKSQQTQFVFIPVHLKSKKIKKGQALPDEWRKDQILQLQAIVRDLTLRYGPRIILGGDFNGDLSRPNLLRPREFGPLWNQGLVNTFEVTSPPTPYRQRTTHTFFSQKGPLHQQLDGFLVSRTLSPHVVESKVVLHLDDRGKPRLAPQNFQELLAQPSDHRLVVLELGR